MPAQAREVDPRRVAEQQEDEGELAEPLRGAALQVDVHELEGGRPDAQAGRREDHGRRDAPRIERFGDRAVQDEDHGDGDESDEHPSSSSKRPRGSSTRSPSGPLVLLLRWPRRLVLLLRRPVARGDSSLHAVADVALSDLRQDAVSRQCLPGIGVESCDEDLNVVPACVALQAADRRPATASLRTGRSRTGPTERHTGRSGRQPGHRGVPYRLRNQQRGHADGRDQVGGERRPPVVLRQPGADREHRCRRLGPETM